MDDGIRTIMILQLNFKPMRGWEVLNRASGAGYVGVDAIRIEEW